MTHDFTPYLPLYAPGTVPERPWWRVLRVPPPVRTAAGYKIPGDYPTFQRIDGVTEKCSRLELAAFDAARPLAAPPPMEGQVWSGRGMVLRVQALGSKGTDWRVWFPGSYPGAGRSDYELSANAYGSGEGTAVLQWPPSNSALLYGPSCYGLNVPWAPMERA